MRLILVATSKKPSLITDDTDNIEEQKNTDLERQLVYA